MFHLLSFQAKGIALKTHKVLLPCSACLVHKEPTKERGEDKRSAACRPVHPLARQRDRRRAAARPLCVRAVTRVLAAGRTTKRERPFIRFACGLRRCGSGVGFLLGRSLRARLGRSLRARLPEQPTSLLSAAHYSSLIQHENGGRAPPCRPGSGAGHGMGARPIEVLSKGGCQCQRTRPQGASGRHPRPPADVKTFV